MTKGILLSAVLVCSIVLCSSSYYYTPWYNNYGYQIRRAFSRQPITKEDLVYITNQYGVTNAVSRSSYLLRNNQQHNSCSSCAYYAKCAVISDIATCACLRGYEGDPLTYCKRVECLDNSECGSHLMCKHGKCVNPCDGMCGVNALCEVKLHIPVCSCPAGYTGHPSQYCRRFDPSELCHPSPCGPNTNCQVYNYTTSCQCLPGYMGSPLSGCKHECDYDTECSSHLACIDNRCQNPCYTRCGTNAECKGVRDHSAICACPQGYYGRADISCRPECTTNSECPSNKPLCSFYTCKDPCDGACGINANCELRGITPICSCPRDMTGSPYVQCRPFEKEDLCVPNPCGANAKCQPGHDDNGNERPVCTCFPGYFGNPLSQCQRGECNGDEDCPSTQACINYKCVNACINQCGRSAECFARNHVAACSCPPGYNGDALESCNPVYSEAYSNSY